MSKKKSPKLERVTLASIDRKIDLLESRIATLKAYETMMAEMEEARTAHPVETEQTPTLKVGDLVVWKSAPREGVVHPPKGVGKVTKVGRTNFTDKAYVDVEGCDGVLGCYWAEDFRPATPEEIAKHKEAEELAKPIGFGTRVKLVSDGIEWRVATEIPDASGSYRLVEYTPDNGPIWRKRHEFTVITE